MNPASDQISYVMRMLPPSIKYESLVRFYITSIPKSLGNGNFTFRETYFLASLPVSAFREFSHEHFWSPSGVSEELAHGRVIHNFTVSISGSSSILAKTNKDKNNKHEISNERVKLVFWNGVDANLAHGILTSGSLSSSY